QSTPTTAAMLQETHTIPILFVQVSDPVGQGFVTSMARPGGNVTGFTNFEPALAGKWRELLKEIAPPVVQAAFLFHPRTVPYAEIYVNPFKTAAPSFGMEAVAATGHHNAELQSVVGAHATTVKGGVTV